MQSVIIEGKNPLNRQKQTEKLLHNASINTFDVTIIDDDSIGIEEVRKIQKAVFLTPLRGKNKAIVFRHAGNITIDAQNALLKVLEEPPEDTLIILETENSKQLLPTILSRCKIVNVIEKVEFLSEVKGVSSLLSLNTGEKLKLAQDKGKSKEDACVFLEQLLSDRHNSISANLLKEVQKTYTIIKTTNVSPRFALENFFLSLIY